MSSIIKGSVGYISGAKAAVSFVDDTQPGTCPEMIDFQNNLNIAMWGEDNRFPQNIVNQMDGYGLGKSALDWKARMLYGGGIVPGKITGYDEKKGPIFEPADRVQHKEVYDFIEASWFHRFMIEFYQDWVWFNNAFPELILSKDCSKITHFVHQESCDARLQQMDKSGSINKVLLSKFWGASKDQVARFDLKKTVQGLREKSNNVNSIDRSLIKEVDCIDLYNPVASLKKIALRKKTLKGLKSAVLPVNYPSVGKTYYQLPTWDGARLAGWIKIAMKIPQLIQLMYSKAFKLKYHIEIPETYFHKKYGSSEWEEKDLAEKESARSEVLEVMEKFLTDEDSGFQSFVSFFDVDGPKQNDVGRVKIETIKDDSTIDKELLTGSAADIQFLIAAGINPTLFGAGTVGTGQQRSGGSDIREAFLVYCAGLNLERQVSLAILYLTRDFNGWDPDLVFRITDTVLTTLDTGAGTTKKLS